MTTPVAHDTIRVGQLAIDFVASSEALAMFEVTVPAGARVPAAHHHVAVDEVVYGLEGVLTMTVDGRTFELSVGETVSIPRGTVHHFDNRHDTTARALTVQTPGDIGPGYYQEIADVLNAGGPPDMARIQDVMARWGLVAAAPKA
jgi:quercetin dioxygenase-like cupin family protein